MKPFYLTHIAGIVLALAISTAVSAGQVITGRVVGVHDGDTITVLDARNQQHRIRFAQIDAPESRQDFGQASKQALSDLVFGETVRVEVETTDRYGRTVGTVWVGSVNTNLEQVKDGMAWVYRQYAHDPAYYEAEEAAKAAKRGLWSRSDAVPPWEFRHGRKSAGAAGTGSPPVSPPRPAATTAAGGSCGSKRTCGQMSSCAEARHYLVDCGVRTLDRDGDGTPCESLCQR